MPQQVMRMIIVDLLYSMQPETALGRSRTHNPGMGKGAG